ncbi:hypothetical protein M440DRAFT_1379605 [Trichoderma longibrachiatum ATCC 18648]|uniref:Uncharacterized protein n=1 Tax=Trichoderma longibrachiatum ATCC 18648 TaxID=983965 RepID=A0A2T4C1J7_TRILO|nr:hypothetical protein M440DRAFT_1379605 [Trichoderma longibrachiatum ATCC 18648]
MDWGEIWLSDDDGGNLEEEDEYPGHPTSFTLGLTYRGQEGDFHVRNLPGQLQRQRVSVRHGGLGKRHAFTAVCNAKAIVHGEMGPPSDKHATLLVFEFKFNSYRGTRIKEADVLFEFQAAQGQAGGPSVLQVRPRGRHQMQQTSQQESPRDAQELSLGVNVVAVDASLKLSRGASADKDTQHFTVVTGDNPQSLRYGDYRQARFALAENRSQASGIPSRFLACVLLERDTDDDFVCVPHVEVKPDFKTMVASLFSSQERDDPILFKVTEPPVIKLDSLVEIDRLNLGAVDLNKLWDCTAYNLYGHAIKESG